jgi:hypothetical protein
VKLQRLIRANPINLTKNAVLISYGKILKTTNKDIESEITCSLDEIDATYSLMADNKNNPSLLAKCKKWIIIQKIALKSLGYKGKIKRKPKTMAPRKQFTL